jgi:hypothetical protein
VAAWEFAGEARRRSSKGPLVYESVKMVKRNYK